MTIFYFAYGSNMLPARLRARCASARAIGCATAHGFSLEFSKKSKDGSGKASLIKTGDTATPGVLFEIASNQLDALDRAEGVGSGYDRVDHFVAELAGTGELMAAKTYFASATDPELRPYDWYLALVIGGARYHALGEDYIRRLRLVEYLRDADHNRVSRRSALEALMAHGFDNYDMLLNSAE